MKRFDNNRHAASYYGDNINRPPLFLPAPPPPPPLSLSRLSERYLIKSDDTVTVYSTRGPLTTRNTECKQRNLLDIFMRPFEQNWKEMFLDVTRGDFNDIGGYLIVRNIWKF